jgi:chemosensory pili system protein ChpA (sensor histidine kinase/response regulator)
MLPEDQKRILGYFIEEAKDHLNTIEQGLLNLNATIHDSEMVNEVFRAAHSVKGGAAMLGINSMQRTAHRMEDFFKVMKESPLTPDQTLESMLLQIFDGLQEQLEHLQSPYGLTEEQGQAILANIEPIFVQAEAHLTSLASGAPAPAAAPAVVTPVAAPAKATHHPETSALQLVFRSDIPELLREMLATFKQADGEASRQQLAHLCQRLHSLGEQLDLPQWCQLVQAVGQAASNREETYRSLAPVIIKDLKQAQDQVLAGQVGQVAASEALLNLLPPQAVEDDSALDALLAEALTDSRDGEDLADLFATAEADPSANLGLEADDSWLDQITDTDAVAFDDAGLESVFGDLDGGTDLATPTASAPGFSGQHHPAIGPQVGTEELNTLADLFEGEQIGLGDLWEEESSGEEEGDDLDSNLSDDDIDSEFADLFQTGGTEASTTDSDDDMASLFGNALAIDLAADDGPEEGLAVPEGITIEPEAVLAEADATDAPAPPAFDAELFDSADAAPAPQAPSPKSSTSTTPIPEVEDFFETVAPAHSHAKVTATEVEDFFADGSSTSTGLSASAAVQSPAPTTQQAPAPSTASLTQPSPTPVAPPPVATVTEDLAGPPQETAQATPTDLPQDTAPVESELDLLFDQLDQDLTVEGEPPSRDLTDSLVSDLADAEIDPFALTDDLELAFGDDDTQSTDSDLGVEIGDATLADDLGLDLDLEADLGFDGDLALDNLSPDADLNLDLDIPLSEAEVFPAADAMPAAKESEAITDPFGGIDLDSLDLLTEEADSGSAEPSTTAAPASEPAEEPAEDWLAELDDLVMDMPPPPEVGAPSAATNGSAINGSIATAALDLDDFSDLEALLEDEVSPPTPTAPIPPSPPAIAIPDEDSFDDLEKLLEGADQLGGSAPSVSGRRGAGVASGRAPRRASTVTDQTMRVNVSHLDNLNNLMGELVVNRNSLEQDQEQLRQSLDNLLNQVQQLNDVGQRMRDLYERSLLESSLMANRQAFALGSSSGGSGGSGNGGSHATGATFDALEMDRFTGFHTLSQEMIELIVRVREASSDIEMTVDSTDQIARQFRQVTTQLQEGLNKARMVPFSQTADRLPRAVRDISIKCGKEAKLVVEGRDTLIDKMILERLYDPMTHLVNNAITHGIETPEERLAAGKAREGTITVRAFYQGNQTVIYIADNGGGINPAVVKAKALKKGLITPAEAQTMTDLDVYDLLFEPGFSTRDQADDFSGRGVGMDVVRTALADIRGSITIESEVGKGTSFTIRLPLTLSITKALSCINNQARIAFPIDGVEDMFDVPKARIQTDAQGHTSILWRDTLLPLRPLGDLLKFNRILGRGRVYGGSHDEDMVSIVVLRSASSFIGLQVDQVIGEQEIVIKQLEGPVPKPTGIAGATVLGDGRVMPIADVLELIDMATGRVRREAPASLWSQPEMEEPEDAKAHTEPTVLIVDDSITVRELLSMSFNKVGYRVEQARDGQEAWDKLRSGLPCDLVFCDIEMPRMDGLELLSRLQKDEALSQIPIAMLTSRGADRHRQMAVDLGAKGYFTKPYLEEMLLDAAQRMLKGETMISLKES